MHKHQVFLQNTFITTKDKASSLQYYNSVGYMTSIVQNI